jgi:ubiquinone biosynthesis protein
MLWQAVTAARDLGRLQHIAAILIRYGFGDMVRRLGLADALEKAGRALHWNEAEDLAHLEVPARVRRALEEMGPTFIKLGQVLATRVDLFDATWIAEFSRLQDNAPTVPWADIHAQLSADLGAAPEEYFLPLIRNPWLQRLLRKCIVPDWKMAAKSSSKCDDREFGQRLRPICAG